MIFPTSSVQGFLDIMKALENINERLSQQYYKLYGDNFDCEEDNHSGFAQAQIKVNEAYDEVANLFSSVLTYVE